MTAVERGYRVRVYRAMLIGGPSNLLSSQTLDPLRGNYLLTLHTARFIDVDGIIIGRGVMVCLYSNESNVNN